MSQINPDLTNPQVSRISFVGRHNYEDVQAPLNLIVELRKFIPNVQQSLKSVAWTIFSLYDPAGDLNIGKWRAPMFKCPTKLGITIDTVALEKDYTGLDLSIRISSPSDVKQEQFKAMQAVYSHYKLAHYHVEQNKNSISAASDD